MADKYPWFPFYAGEFLNDEKVLVMSYREVGIYLFLLCHQWVQGSIPADPSRAQAMLKLGSSVAGDDADFGALAHVMAECFDADPDQPGRLINPRLAEIQERQTATRQRLSEGGRRGGKARSLPQASLEPSSSLPQAYKRERKKKELLQPERRDEPTRTPVAIAGDLWKTRRGEPSYPRIGKALKPLLAARGAKQVLLVWEGYLLDRDGKPYATPEDFAQNYELYRKKWGQVMGEDGCTWEPMPDEPEAAA